MNDENERSVASTGSVDGPRDGALSGCETVPDADSRVWETHPPVCHVPLQKNLTLTDTEREALQAAIDFCDQDDKPLPSISQMDLLRGLLERTK